MDTANLIHRTRATEDYGICIILDCERNCVSHKEKICSQHVKMRKHDKLKFYSLERKAGTRKMRKDAGTERGPYHTSAFKPALRDNVESDVFWGKTVQESLALLRDRIAADRAAGILLG